MRQVIALVPLGDDDVPDTAGALARVNGVTLLAHAVRRLVDSGCVDRIVIAGPHATPSGPDLGLDPDSAVSVLVTSGNADRIESARCALRRADPRPSDVVLVHDPVRPFTPPETIRAVVAAVRDGASVAVPVEPVTDTVKVLDASGDVLHTLDRDRLRRAQSPRGFSAALLDHADLTEVCSLTGAAASACPVPGHPHGMRVSTPYERTVAEAVFAQAGERDGDENRSGSRRSPHRAGA
nr:2-C-methyl-D-erythritol 4-phosphate cytidylyltransferase [Saccharomonospora piscinae]